jgi:hypothetical protein
MLRIAPLSRQDQRTLRQWQGQATPRLAQRVRLIRLRSPGLVGPCPGSRLSLLSTLVASMAPCVSGPGVGGVAGPPLVVS